MNIWWITAISDSHTYHLVKIISKCYIEDYTVSPWERIHRKDGRHNGQDATQQVDSFQAPVKSRVCALI